MREADGDRAREIKELQKQKQATDAQIDALEFALAKCHNLFETKEHVKKFTDRLEKFASIEHVEMLQKYYVPKLEKFSDMVDKYVQDNVEIRAVVRTYDEVLS